MSVNNPQLNMDGFMQDPLAQMNFQSSMAQNIGQAVANSINQSQAKPLTIQQPQERKDSQLEYLDFEIDKKINALQKEFSELAQKKQELEQSITGIETKLAANRARRIKKNDDVLSHWRWKQEQNQKKEIADMQYNWQKEQNSIEDSLGQMTSRNEFNGSLNAALQQWQTAKKSGDAIAEAYAKQNVDQLVNYGQAKFGIDFQSKIKEAEDLAKKNAETEAQNKATEEAHIQHIAGLENKIRYLQDDDTRLEFQKVIMNDNNLSETEKRDLLSKDELMTVAQREQKAQDSSKVEGAGKATAEAIAASKMTFDELLTAASSRALNKYELKRLDVVYPLSARKADKNAYEKMDKTDRKVWAKQNPGKFKILGLGGK